MTTFMDAYRAGVVDEGRILDWIDDWHTAEDGKPPTKLCLHEWLGLTWDEFDHWVRKGELPPRDTDSVPESGLLE